MATHWDAAFLAAKGRAREPLLVCDLTQSYAPEGGGDISTYLREKRDYVIRHTPHRLLQIVPGPHDRITVKGRHIFAEVGAEPVRGSPNNRFILRTDVVRALLAQYRPAIIESLCPWLLPWTAIKHRREFPDTVLVAGYRTDFPNAQVYRVARARGGERFARLMRLLSYGYAEVTYREFDWTYALSADAQHVLARKNISRTSLLSLGVDARIFHPAKRDPGYRGELGLGGEGPLLIYAGRLDDETRADQLIEMFRRLPRSLGADMVVLGDGKLRRSMAMAARGLPIAFPGFERSRNDLARALASSDIYVTAMADETFGVSVLEAQASGLPVVGVRGGAMPDRVRWDVGRLGPVDDMDAMAENVVRVWNDNPRAKGARARRMIAEASGWDRSFATLFNDIYPAAMARAAERREEEATYLFPRLHGRLSMPG